MSARIWSPSPPAPAKNASAASPTVVVAAIRSPAMISGSASGSSTRQSSWRSVSPMPAAGVARLLGHVVEPVDDVAEEDQQRVGGQRDDRRRVAAPGDRQQQEEEREARDRVEDPRDLGDRRDEPAPAVGEQRERERDREADADRDDDQARGAARTGERSGRSGGRSSSGRSRCRPRSCRPRGCGRSRCRPGRAPGRQRGPPSASRSSSSWMTSIDRTPRTRPSPSMTGP